MMIRNSGGGRRHPSLLLKLLALLVLCALSSMVAAEGQTCSVKVEGRRDGSISTIVVCSGIILMDKIVEEPMETSVPRTPLILFESAPHFTSIVKISKDGGDKAFNLVDSAFVGLIGGDATVAPLVVDDLRVSISNSRFERNSGFQYGAISMVTAAEPAQKNSSSLFVSGCSFVNNSNGAIYLASVPVVDVIGCAFIHNQGVAVRSNGLTDLTVERSTVTGAGKRTYSAGIQGVGGRNLFVIESSFRDLTSPESGGAVSWAANADASADVALYRSRFYDNYGAVSGSKGRKPGLGIQKSGLGSSKLSGGRGGAISVIGAANVIVSESDFQGDCIEEGSGGAIGVSHAGSMTIIDSRFSENRALYYGGAVSMYDVNSVKVSGGKVRKSTAGTGGGIHVANVNDSAVFDGVSFEENTADGGSGGAMNIAEARNVYFTALGVSNNRAKVKGGGVAFFNSDEKATLVISTTQFTFNRAPVASSIDIIGCGKGAVNMSAVTFAFNHATDTEAAQGTTVAVCRVSSVSVSDSVVKGNSGNWKGHVLIQSADTVVLSDSTFQDTSSGPGCRLNAISTAVNVLESHFANNTGGGLSVTDSGDILISHSGFYKNSAEELGGGMHLDNVGGVSLLNVNVSGNARQLKPGGGAAISHARSVVVGNSTWLANTAREGGALYLNQAGDVGITASTFLGNTVEQRGEDNGEASGGAVWLNASYATAFNFRDNTVDRCHAKDGEGGGIWFGGTGGLMNVVNSKFTRCLAKKGGAIKATGMEDMSTDLAVIFTVQDSNFIQNVAYDEGGSICIENTNNAMIVDSSVKESVAFTWGGGVSISNVKDSAVVDSVEFTLNKAREGTGGGMMMAGCSNATFKEASFDRNSAGTRGGGMAVALSNVAEGVSEAASLRIVDTRFANNTAVQSGGALNVEGKGNVQLVENRFDGNRADTGGVASLYGDMKAVAIKSYFGLNEANEDSQIALCGAALKLDDCWIVVPYKGPNRPLEPGDDAFGGLSDCPESNLLMVQNVIEFKEVGKLWTFGGLRMDQWIWIMASAGVFVLAVAGGIAACILRARIEAKKLQDAESNMPLLTTYISSCFSSVVEHSGV